jgi:hypothetical protein
MLRDEKMIEAVTIKMSVTVLAQVRAIAEADGIGLSEYVRGLIDRDIEHHRSRFVALSTIFGADTPSGKE